MDGAEPRSVSSWPKAGCPQDRQAVAATDMAAADHMLNFDVIAELPCLATSQGERAPTGGRAKACVGGTRYAN